MKFNILGEHYIGHGCLTCAPSFNAHHLETGFHLLDLFRSLSSEYVEICGDKFEEEMKEQLRQDKRQLVLEKKTQERN